MRNCLMAVLFLLTACLVSCQQSPKTPASEAPSSANPLKIAYIRTDSVLAGYDYFKAAKSKLENKGGKLQKELEARAKSFQGEVSAYQNNLNSLTIGQAKAVEEGLARKQQDFQMYQQKLEQELAGEQQKMNTELYKKISSFLKKYGDAKELDAVFKLDSSSDMLYGNAALDITAEVLAGLNEEYKKQAADASTPEEKK